MNAEIHESELGENLYRELKNENENLRQVLKRIAQLATEWNANRLGPIELQRKRWVQLGRIAQQAIEEESN